MRGLSRNVKTNHGHTSLFGGGLRSSSGSLAKFAETLVRVPSASSSSEHATSMLCSGEGNDER